MWIDDDSARSSQILELAPDDSDLNSISRQVPGDGIGDDPYAPAPHSEYALGKSLNINDYVEWDEGGTYAPEYWMGYSTGMDPADFRSYAMTGEVAVPENQLALALSESSWGPVSMPNTNSQLLAGTQQNENAWLPPANVLANLALIPGFGTEL